MGADASADVFRAISDPTRRRLLDLLRDEERSVSDLVSELDISQPAVSQHLKILLATGLVSARRDGKRRLFRATPEPLLEIYDWLGHYQRFWTKKLDALGTYLDDQNPKTSTNPPKSKKAEAEEGQQEPNDEA